MADETAPIAGIRVSVLPADIPGVLASMQNTKNSSGLRWRATTQTSQGVIDIHWLNVDGESSTEHVSGAISKTIKAVQGVGGTPS